MNNLLLSKMWIIVITFLTDILLNNNFPVKHIRHILYRNKKSFFLQIKENYILTDIPEVISAKFDENEDGTQWFTLTIKSIPEPFLIQWRKREKRDDTFQLINVNADEFKGSSCSFPHPVLVIKQREQLENFYFQIKIKNFIGTCKKTIQGILSILYFYTYVYYVCIMVNDKDKTEAHSIHVSLNH